MALPVIPCSDVPDLAANQTIATFLCDGTENNYLCTTTCFEGTAFFCWTNAANWSIACSTQAILADCPELGFNGSLGCPMGGQLVNCLRDGLPSAGCL